MTIVDFFIPTDSALYYASIILSAFVVSIPRTSKASIPILRLSALG
jgi:hypothetical protein